MSTYTVVRQQPDQYDFTNPANPVLGVLVEFQTSEGNVGTVFVPNNRYTVKNVRTMLAAKAKLTDEIAALEGTY